MGFFDFLKTDPIDIVPSYTKEGKKIVYQEVIPLTMEYSQKEAYNRSKAFFSNDKNIKELNNSYGLYIKNLNCDDINSKLEFEYDKVLAGSYGGNHSWSGGMEGSLTVEFRDSRFRYTNKVEYLSYILLETGEKKWNGVIDLIDWRRNFFPYWDNELPKGIKRADNEESISGATVYLKRLIFNSVQNKTDDEW